MNRIDELFRNAKSTGRRAFMPFLTAGDPDLDTTAKVALELVRGAEGRGVPILLEIGFPYTDPIADGPTIQASYTRALDKGVRIDAIFEMVRGLRCDVTAPLVAMVSYSLVQKAGAERFLGKAKESGFDGAIVPDLPVEESRELTTVARRLDFRTIGLIAPTTPPERAERIAAASTGFVYYISVTGITGERDRLPSDLVARIERLRQTTSLPICVGFGIGKPEHVELLRPIADGVIVGSAIVTRIGRLQGTDPASLAELVGFVDSLMAPLSAAK